MRKKIDRIDNNAGYFKENCRWVTRTENVRNTGVSKWWFIKGVRYESLSHAAKMTGVNQSTIQYRFDNGFTGYSSEKKYSE